MAGLTRYDNSDKVIDTQKISTSTWSDNTNNLTTAFTSSTQTNAASATSSGAFFREIYNDDISSSAQYAIAYGHKEGSGSLNFTDDNGSKGKSPSKVIYNQYRQLIYGDEASNFSFNGHTPDEIFVININRARYKHNLKPGTLNLTLSGSGTPGNGATATLKLTDDSVSATGSATITNVGRQFNIVSGSSGVMSGSSLTNNVLSNNGLSGGKGSYGFFYPDAGFIILNGDALSASLHISTSVASNSAQNILSNNAPRGNNIHAFWRAITGSQNFEIDSEEKVTSQYFFTRAKNNEYNYTTNPSFIDTNGNLNYTSMVDNPKTFITTIGLYNDSNDLVAVAKVSQPISKDFSKEALMRVKLDY